jgi:hypothetical protein
MSRGSRTRRSPETISWTLWRERVPIFSRRTDLSTGGGDSLVQVDRALEVAFDLFLLVKPTMPLRVLEDDADNRVLECAVEGRAGWIISGDHHLLSLGEFRGIPIVRVSDFLSK